MMIASRITKELHTKVFESTLALYRVTDFFPPDEILRKQTRQKANEIFSEAQEYGFSENREHESAVIIAKIQALIGYLNIARSMRFVKPINLTILEREYTRIASFFEQELHSKKEEKNTPDSVSSVTRETESKKTEIRINEVSAPVNKNTKEVINNRQRTILEHLRVHSQAKISDFYQVFGDISAKTIQRDLQDLVTKRLLEKEGEKRWTVYFSSNDR